MAQSISDMSVTWPDGSTYNGIKLNVNDAGPSSASSLLMDLRVGSATRFGVAKNGNTRIAGNGYFWVLDTNTTANRLLFSANGVASFCAISDGFLSTNYQFAASASANADLFLFRDAANTLAQRNGANAQAFRLYGTYTAADNFQRLAITSASVTLSALSGASVTATGLIPAGAVVMGVTSRVSTLITGADGYQIGTGADADRWADKTGVAVGTTTDNRDWTAGTIENFAAATDVIVTAKTANFTAGAIVVTVHYLAGQAD